MSEKYRVLVAYENQLIRVVADSISLNAALTLEDGFWSIDDGDIQSITIEKATK